MEATSNVSFYFLSVSFQLVASYPYKRGFMFEYYTFYSFFFFLTVKHESTLLAFPIFLHICLFDPWEENDIQICRRKITEVILPSKKGVSKKNV